MLKNGILENDGMKTIFIKIADNGYIVTARLSEHSQTGELVRVATEQNLNEIIEGCINGLAEAEKKIEGSKKC
jgi:hypothetical protein